MPKVMLAEDDATMLGLLKTLLKMEGYQTISLEAGADVVTEVLNQRPDMLLMDVHLFNKNGLEILKQLRASPGGEAVRVVMSSGMDMRTECLKSGANAFLMKPFMPDDLMSALRE